MKKLLKYLKPYWWIAIGSPIKIDRKMITTKSQINN